MPSTRSSVAIASSKSRRSFASPAVSDVSSAASTACLASFTASGGRRAITRASSMASSSHSRLRRHLVHEAESHRLLGVDAPAGQDELHGALLADHACEALRAAAAGDDPERDLRLPELGGLGGDDHVAHQGQLAAAAEGESGHRGDHRRAAGCEPVPERDRRGLQHVLERALRHRLDVGAGGEHLGAAGNHDAVTSGSPSSSSTASASSPITSGDSALRRSGRSSVTIPTASSDLDHLRDVLHRPVYFGISALMPVASRPMISFWICEVPS